MSSKRDSESEVSLSTTKKQCTKAIAQNWQGELKTPVDRMIEMFKHSRLTDLTISFPECQTKLQVHKLILAMTSPVFECMFYGPMAEQNELELPEDPLDAFKMLLQYIYSVEIDFPDVSTAVEVYRLSHKYQIDDLSLLCSKYLKETLNEDNLPLIFETASLLGDQNLLRECRLMINFSSDSVLSSPAIGQCSRESMRVISKALLSVYSEVAVYNGIIEWGRAQESHTKDTAEPQGLREIVNEFLPFVNFLSMSLEEYLEHVVPSNVFTSDESLAILMNIKEAKDIPLPLLCRQEGKRLVWLKSTPNLVSLSNLPSSFCGHTDNNEGNRQKIISDLKVNSYLCLGSIRLCFEESVRLSEWVIEVTDSSEKVIRKVESNNSGNQSSFCNISAILNRPLLLRPKNVYNIWIHSNLKNSTCKEFCVQVVDSLMIKGSIWQETETKLDLDFRKTIFFMKMLRSYLPENSMQIP